MNVIKSSVTDEIFLILKELAVKNKRSLSSQIAYMLEEKIKDSQKNDYLK